MKYKMEGVDQVFLQENLKLWLSLDLVRKNKYMSFFFSSDDANILKSYNMYSKQAQKILASFDEKKNLFFLTKS